MRAVDAVICAASDQVQHLWKGITNISPVWHLWLHVGVPVAVPSQQRRRKRTSGTGCSALRKFKTRQQQHREYRENRGKPPTPPPRTPPSLSIIVCHCSRCANLALLPVDSGDSVCLKPCSLHTVAFGEWQRGAASLALSLLPVALPSDWSGEQGAAGRPGTHAVCRLRCSQ